MKSMIVYDGMDLSFLKWNSDDDNHNQIMFLVEQSLYEWNGEMYRVQWFSEGINCIMEFDIVDLNFQDIVNNYLADKLLLLLLFTNDSL